MKKISELILLALFSSLIFSCGEEDDKADSSKIKNATPVTITSITQGALTQTVELSATSSFQQKTIVKANSTGYLADLNIRSGDFINKGETLFTIKSKEAASIGNTINKIDSSFHFKGVSEMKSPVSGYISEVNFSAGDFVQEGEQVLTVSDASSFAFVLSIPYEQISLLKNNSSLVLHLPDGSTLNGTLDKAMPMVDAATQTQNILIRVQSNQMIPENLIAKVELVKSKKENAVTLPSDAVLSDETQKEFWVFKLMNDSTAVKIPIEKGVENGDAVEILSPEFSSTDKFLLTGNYGLPDTAIVQIENNK